jgi:hypothetical protein
MGNGSRRAIEHKEPRGTTRTRFLRDQLIREVKVEISNPHGRDYSLTDR